MTQYWALHANNMISGYLLVSCAKYILLNLLYSLQKSDKTIGKPHILSLSPTCLTPLYINGFFLLLWYDKYGIVHYTYWGVSGCNLKKNVFFVWRSLLPLQTVYNLMKCSIMLHFIWFFTVCKSTLLGVRVNKFNKHSCKTLRISFNTSCQLEIAVFKVQNHIETCIMYSISQVVKIKLSFLFHRF